MSTSCKSLKEPEHGDDMGDEMVSIQVDEGAKQKAFSIHQKILQKFTKFFDKQCQAKEGLEGKQGIVMKDEDAEIFQMFYDWLYTGNIEKPPVQFKVKKMPSEAQAARLEADLRARFDAAQLKLVDLYCLAEKLDINDLQNRTIDTIQDGFHEYGTVFGPGLLVRVFKNTKKGSQLRELCIATNIIHMDRGCNQLREEFMIACMICEDFMPLMLKWISRNFSMIGRRYKEGWDSRKCNEGFSMLNRSKLCPCWFHKHAPGEAHKFHKRCKVPHITCGHDHKEDEEVESLLLRDLDINRA